MKKLNLILSLLIVSILISGCTQKEPKIIYKEAPYYDFQIISLKGAYLELTENQQICVPLLQQINTIYKQTKTFYDEQIEDYKKQREKIKN